MKKQKNKRVSLKLNKFSIAKLNVNTQTKIVGGSYAPTLGGGGGGNTIETVDQ